MVTLIVPEGTSEHEPTVGGHLVADNNDHGDRWIAGSLLGLSGMVTAFADPTPTDTFANTGSMGGARTFQTASPLNNGKVLVAGGNGVCDGFCWPPTLATAELYDPVSAEYSPTGSMTTPRVWQTSSVLADGRVLVVGGKPFLSEAPLATAELYDPNTSDFTATADSMATARYLQTATVLANGKVLIAGGQGDGTTALATAELFDPTTGTFTPTSGNMSTARTDHKASLLPNGQVLITGGRDDSDPSAEVASADLYDPTTNSFTATGPMQDARARHTSTTLDDGLVLVAGGVTGAEVLDSAELFNPNTGVFSVTGDMTTPRARHTASSLAKTSGMVLLAGGESDSASAQATSEQYSSETGTFGSTSGPMSVSRASQTATVLSNGNVLVAGGSNAAQEPVASSEVYTPTIVAPGPVTGVSAAPAGPGQLAVGWDSQARADSYTATATSAVSGSVSAQTSKPSCTTSTNKCTITGLNSSEYTVSVVATNTAGSSAGSTPTTPVTPVAYTPAAPLSATYSNLRRRRALVRWAGSLHAVGYRVLVNGRTKCTTNASKSQCRIRKAWGRRATVQVVALGASSNSPARNATFSRSKRAIVFGRVHFRPYSAKLNKRSKRTLRRYARLLADQGFKRVTLNGFTARNVTRGSWRYRKRLSRARARVAKRVINAKLRRLNVRIRIVIVARSGRNPVGSNLTSRGQAKNRRATIIIS